MTGHDAEQEVRSCLAGFVDDADASGRDEDLIATRTVSSLVFMSLIYTLEERSGREVDLESARPEQLRTIAGLSGLYFAVATETT